MEILKERPKPRNWAKDMMRRLNSTFIPGKNAKGMVVMELNTRLGTKKTFDIPESCQNKLQLVNTLTEDILVRAIIVGLDEHYMKTDFKLVTVTSESFVYMNLATPGITKYVRFEDYMFSRLTNELRFVEKV